MRLSSAHHHRRYGIVRVNACGSFPPPHIHSPCISTIYLSIYLSISTYLSVYLSSLSSFTLRSRIFSQHFFRADLSLDRPGYTIVELHYRWCFYLWYTLCHHKSITVALSRVKIGGKKGFLKGVPVKYHYTHKLQFLLYLLLVSICNLDRVFMNQIIRIYNLNRVFLNQIIENCKRTYKLIFSTYKKQLVKNALL